MILIHFVHRGQHATAALAKAPVHLRATAWRHSPTPAGGRRQGLVGALRWVGVVVSAGDAANGSTTSLWLRAATPHHSS